MTKKPDCPFVYEGMNAGKPMNCCDIDRMRCTHPGCDIFDSIKRLRAAGRW